MPGQIPIVIRKLQASDASVFDELVISALDDCLGEVLPTAELQACARAYRVRHTHQIHYVADADGTLIGYATALCDPSGNASAGNRVERLYVNHHGLGETNGAAIAALLIDAMCIGKSGIKSVPTADSDTVLALYKRWGFVDINAFGLCLSVPSGHGRFMTEALAA
jgi:GNAT superfamily N-acetyltransferase